MESSQKWKRAVEKYDLTYRKPTLSIDIIFKFQFNTLHRENYKGTEVQKKLQKPEIMEELKKKDVYIIKCKHNTEKPKWRYCPKEPK